MNIVALIAFYINLIILVLFSGAQIFILKSDILPKIRATYTVVLGIFMFLYLLSVVMVCVMGVINKQYELLSLLTFIVVPFIIGHFVKYKTLKFYAVIQILVFMISAYSLFIICG